MKQFPCLAEFMPQVAERMASFVLSAQFQQPLKEILGRIVPLILVPVERMQDMIGDGVLETNQRDLV